MISALKMAAMVSTQNRSIITAAEFAELVGVKLATIRRWVREGRVPAVILPNGCPLFDLTEVQQTLRDKEGKVGPAVVSAGREQGDPVTVHLSEGGR